MYSIPITGTQVFASTCENPFCQTGLIFHLLISWIVKHADLWYLYLSTQNKHTYVKEKVQSGLFELIQYFA